MPKRLIKVGRLNDSVSFEGDVEFCQNCTIAGDLTAKRIVTVGLLEVRGTLTCDAIEHPTDKLPICGRFILDGVDMGGSKDAESPVIADPEEVSAPEKAEELVDGTAEALESIGDVEDGEEDPVLASLQGM